MILYSHRTFTCSCENTKNNNNSPNLMSRQPQCLMLKSRLLLWLLVPFLSHVSPSAFGWSLNGLTVLRAFAVGYCWNSKWQLLLKQGPNTPGLSRLLENAIWGSQAFWADHLLYSGCSCASSNLIAPVIVSKEGGLLLIVNLVVIFSEL